ncbi:hypothetical protein TVAG_432540 [Trichomonas vaginalis G3]|uniref:Dolichyl-diphosphooligosaccharide-protein glycosyltransferase subunit OST5 n=1 Tax=Trichomonas vaginalis (strain ATCC PRA-98 / G3) TaxID=412133 RepID=A2DIP5_TRIV3|nr:hypothetical protein TVAGG3_0562700 [Trichomonas vaginalis G3]EAY19658.1 hypothetical protein TVAG_432540 [Trichomonas vaginalis G3]KAI5521322.1 hypothetical protein TVAGG3_0562700 [Trichomonas vaginalis G3]|eukprot:XP_001580644.1 hypothetical protein [Trichomonas vaginalis G3]
MGEFKPILDSSAKKVVYLAVSILAVFCVVAFFLYENKSKRNFFTEVILAVGSACSLGTAIFFALVKADVVL